MRVSEIEKMPIKVFMACMAFDAYRICFGKEPHNFTVDQVKLWMDKISTEVEIKYPKGESRNE